MRFSLRPAGGGDFREHEGDLSLGGVAFSGEAVEAGRYDVHFRLPGQEGEVRVRAEALGAGAPGRVTGKVQLRFVDLDTAAELAIARYLDALAGTAR
jgi:hypothetical protein